MREYEVTFTQTYKTRKLVRADNEQGAMMELQSKALEDLPPVKEGYEVTFTVESVDTLKRAQANVESRRKALFNQT